MFFRVISVIDRLPQALDRVTNSGSTEIDIDTDPSVGYWHTRVIHAG